MSTPLLTEVMNFFQENEQKFKGEDQLESLVQELQNSLDECLDAETGFE